jgi:hypothetical protein
MYWCKISPLARRHAEFKGISSCHKEVINIYKFFKKNGWRGVRR